MWFFASQDIIWFFLLLFGAFREKQNKTKQKNLNIFTPGRNHKTKLVWKTFFFLSKGFLIFVLHCVRNSQVSFKTWGFKTWMYLECGSFSYFLCLSVPLFVYFACLSAD